MSTTITTVMEPYSTPVIDLDRDDTESDLTSAHSGETPTLPSDEQPTIRALHQAATDSEYDLCVARIPRENKLKIEGITYVKYDPYRPRKSKRTAWYWAPDQGEELIRTKKGIALFPPSY
jgi:hypothetical protein